MAEWIEEGKKAPAFTLLDDNNQKIKLSSFKGQYVVLYFYPKDDTPGCTIEANQFTALATEFSKHNTVILGVSQDSCTSHLAFIDKFGLKVDLLADTSGELCKSYGVWQEKERNGEKKMGIVRSTFIIDKNGVLADVEYGVNHEGHAQSVLDKIKQL